MHQQQRVLPEGVDKGAENDLIAQIVVAVVVPQHEEVTTLVHHLTYVGTTDPRDRRFPLKYPPQRSLAPVVWWCATRAPDRIAPCGWISSHTVRFCTASTAAM